MKSKPCDRCGKPIDTPKSPAYLWFEVLQENPRRMKRWFTCYECTGLLSRLEKMRNAQGKLFDE